jgi:hypothetical protein
MSSKSVEPQLGAESFSCPHCGAFAQQHFLKLFAKSYSKQIRPSVSRYDDDILASVKSIKDEKRGGYAVESLQRLKKHALTYFVNDEYGETCHWEMANLTLSRCFSCEGFAVWMEDRLIYPIKNSAIVAHEEMPDTIRKDFDEAASILNLSPRGAAALLRLCIQKLMPILDEKGKDLNEDIGSLVRKGLESKIQQALDIVRVTGNHAVHPGQIDLEDNKAIAISLFELVNLIVEKRIATPNRIATMFKGLPPKALEAIEKRDAPKQIEKKGSE